MEWIEREQNSTAYASSPKVEVSSSLPGSSRNYVIWEESTRIGTWDLRRLTSPDTFLGALFPATAQTVLLVFHPKEYIDM